MQTELAGGALLILFIWTVGVGLYRLYFSPLAKFPGSKLAALTGWVETYHDVFRGGQFIFKLEEWHAKYGENHPCANGGVVPGEVADETGHARVGPVVRISPWEVHIADPEFADVLFASNSQFDKKIEWKHRFGIPHSTFDTIEHHHHRARRSALAPFFSKQKLAGITDFIAAKAQRLSDRLDDEFRGTGKPATLNNCFTAFTFDIVTFYAFARPFEYMEHPTFNGPFTNAAKALATTLHTMGHFPWLLALLQSLPRRLSMAMDPNMAAVFAFHGAIEDQIRAIKSGTNDAHKYVSHKTIFNELLSSDLPPEEKAVERLKHEGGSIVAGGVETTATALSKATFFILDEPRIRERLAGELATAFPDPRQTPSLAALEALPYLSAVVSETLRLTIGISQRTIRKSRRAPVSLGNGRGFIPAGAYFSMTTYLTHVDESVWGPDARDFRPERWLGEKPAAPAKFLLPFGRGPRMCIGMNLARAELFIGLAVLFRRCDLTLFETTRAAVDMHADYFIPLPDRKSRGVRVLVR